MVPRVPTLMVLLSVRRRRCVASPVPRVSRSRTCPHEHRALARPCSALPGWFGWRGERAAPSSLAVAVRLTRWESLSEPQPRRLHLPRRTTRRAPRCCNRQHPGGGFFYPLRAFDQNEFPLCRLARSPCLELRGLGMEAASPCVSFSSTRPCTRLPAEVVRARSIFHTAYGWSMARWSAPACLLLLGFGLGCAREVRERAPTRRRLLLELLVGCWLLV